MSDVACDQRLSRYAQAAVWLEGFLAAGARPGKEIMAVGLLAGFTKDNVEKARISLRREGKICRRCVWADGVVQWWWGPSLSAKEVNHG